MDIESKQIEFGSKVEPTELCTKTEPIDFGALITKYTPHIRLGSAFANLVVAALNINYVSQVPKCCGSIAKGYANLAYTLMTFAILISLINLVHLSRNWPKLTVCNFYIAGCAEAILGSYTFFGAITGQLDFGGAIVMILCIGVDWIFLVSRLKAICGKRGTTIKSFCVALHELLFFSVFYYHFYFCTSCSCRTIYRNFP